MSPIAVVSLPFQSFADNSGDKSRTGALTDGLKWSIYHFFNGNWYLTDLCTKDEASSIRLLRIKPGSKSANVAGVLVFLVAGRFPSTDPNDALWIIE